jgi:phosphohistidine swiveling domain-containing protein
MIAEPAPLVTEPANPVHIDTAPATRWTTVNFAEAIQGVQTPLGWTFWSHGMEEASARSFFEMGVFDSARIPDELGGEPFAGIFYGRAAGNIEVFHYVGDRIPGSSGEVVVAKMLGVSGEGAAAYRTPAAAYARYPFVLAKLPTAALRATRQLPARRAEVSEWWRDRLLDRPPRDLESAQRLLAEALPRFIAIATPHATVSMLGNGLLDALCELGRRATGDSSLALDLATGYGAMEECALIEDLLAAARARLELRELVQRHGYHGPDEGNLRSRSWREDSQPLERLVAGYRRRGDIESPLERQRRQSEHRLKAERRLLAALPRTQRTQARLTMRLAQRFIPLREVGKAAFLHTLDAARCGARAAGATLADRGVLDGPEDVFFLTYHELFGPMDDSVGERVEARKARHRRYEKLELPQSWTGAPTPTPPREKAATAGRIESLVGVGVAGDRVSGRARVVHDPARAELDPGDVLVCRTTDPSWTPLFMVAEGLVIDTGGAMSHGAIVARELGLTCVINTVTGTRDIPDGATITVDARRGTVTVDNGHAGR